MLSSSPAPLLGLFCVHEMQLSRNANLTRHTIFAVPRAHPFFATPRPPSFPLSCYYDDLAWRIFWVAVLKQVLVVAGCAVLALVMSGESTKSVMFGIRPLVKYAALYRARMHCPFSCVHVLAFTVCS